MPSLGRLHSLEPKKANPLPLKFLPEFQILLIQLETSHFSTYQPIMRATREFAPPPRAEMIMATCPDPSGLRWQKESSPLAMQMQQIFNPKTGPALLPALWTS